MNTYLTKKHGTQLTSHAPSTLISASTETMRESIKSFRVKLLLLFEKKDNSPLAYTFPHVFIQASESVVGGFIGPNGVCKSIQLPLLLVIDWDILLLLDMVHSSKLP